MLNQGINNWPKRITMVLTNLGLTSYQKLNEKTIDDRYPLPNVTDILDKLGRFLNHRLRELLPPGRNALRLRIENSF